MKIIMKDFGRRREKTLFLPSKYYKHTLLIAENSDACQIIAYEDKEDKFGTIIFACHWSNVISIESQYIKTEEKK